MALNVYLTFFKNFNASDLRRLEKWYFVFCYGIPLIPAMIFLILDATADLGIYGHATVSSHGPYSRESLLTFTSCGVGSPGTGIGCASPSSTGRCGKVARCDANLWAAADVSQGHHRGHDVNLP